MAGFFRLTGEKGTVLPVVYLLGALAGALFLVLSTWTIVKNRQAREWPVTEGVVVESRTFLERAGDPKGNGRVPRAAVRFRYSVGGKTYESYNVSFRRGFGDGDFDPARQGSPHSYDPGLAVKYPQGTKVQVAYNPQSPGEAVVEASRDPWVSLVLGLAAVVGYAGWVWWFNWGRAR